MNTWIRMNYSLIHLNELQSFVESFLNFCFTISGHRHIMIWLKSICLLYKLAETFWWTYIDVRYIAIFIWLSFLSINFLLTIFDIISKNGQSVYTLSFHLMHEGDITKRYCSFAKISFLDVEATGPSDKILKSGFPLSCDC